MAASMSWEDARQRLRKIRERQIRSSEEVVTLWEEILQNFTYKLGNEVWVVYEQVCIAACDCGKGDVAEFCVEALSRQFPGSSRVLKLSAMLEESEEQYDRALKIYNKILETDENNSIVKKRIISILRSQNKIADAIKELNNYLKNYQSDYEAWAELCDLYIMEQDFPKAAFCCEELMLSNPHSHLYMQKYAEIKYTQGGLENLQVARAYFSRAYKLNEHNIRALFGLFMSASNLASMPRASSRDKKDNIKYAAWAADNIMQKYKNIHGESLVSNIKAIFPLQEPTTKQQQQPATQPHQNKKHKQSKSKAGESTNAQVKCLEGMLDNLQITQST